MYASDQKTSVHWDEGGLNRGGKNYRLLEKGTSGYKEI